MDVSFKNEYIVEVFIFVLVIYFCKNVLQCLDAAISLFQKLSCDCPICYGVTCQEMCRLSLITFSAIQPMLLCIIVPMHMSFSKEPIDSYIFTTSININSSTADMLHHQSLTRYTNETMVVTEFVTFTKIDLRIFVIPFSATASAATAAWLFLCREGMFNSDPTWDDSLFEVNCTN